jgi:hypothetical protein
MTQEHQPATKGDFEMLSLHFNELERKVEAFKDEILRHFDVIVEDLRHDLIGARSDEIEVLKDGRRNHEERLRRLERSVGLVA